MTFALFKEKDYKQLSSKALEKIDNKTKEKMFQLFLIGARDLKLGSSYLSNRKISIGLNIPTSTQTKEKLEEELLEKRSKYSVGSQKARS